MDFNLTDEQKILVDTTREACARYDDRYWRNVEREKRYPSEFVDFISKEGFLAITIPEEYGGGNGRIMEAALVAEEIAKSGGDGGALRAQIYLSTAFNKVASREQKEKYLPDIASGKLRFQTFAVTEQEAGTNTLAIKTFAKKEGDSYIINGMKMWISRVFESDLMLLLARTSKKEDAPKKTLGLTLFLVNVRKALKNGSVKANPIDMMINHSANEVMIEDLEVPAENVVGIVDRGFYHVLSFMNSERIINSSDTIGSTRYLLNKATEYAKNRVVFDRPIGQNQGIQFPLAAAYAKLEAATILRNKAAWMYDKDMECGKEANILKYLSSEIGVEAANVAMSTMGGMGMATEGGIERKFREMRLHIIAPVSNNLALAYIGNKVMGMPKSY